MAKIDIADGFYRLGLAPWDVPKLGVLLPQMGDEEPMVALPFVLPIGWIHSPPFFSAVTETAVDVMNHRLNQGREQPPHRLETLALAEVSPPVVDSPPATGSSPTVPVPSDIIHKPGYKRPLRYADI